MNTQASILVLLTICIINVIKADPCSHTEYFMLDDHTRNVNYGFDNYCCDYSGDIERSPDWAGPNWYRMVGPAGTMLSEIATQAYHCNAGETGWLNGVHPTMEDGTVTRSVCFTKNEDTCRYQTEIQVRNCGFFFVYFLPDVNLCSLRYCSSF